MILNPLKWYRFRNRLRYHSDPGTGLEVFFLDPKTGKVYSGTSRFDPRLEYHADISEEKL